MKPLDAEARRLIAEAQAEDLPRPGAEERLWQALAQQLDRPLPPTAARAHEALSLAKAASGLSAAVMAGGAVGIACVGAAIWFALQPTAAVPPASRAPHVVVPASSEGSVERVSTLSEEAELIAEAQRALHSDTPERALVPVERHARRFPEGALAQEREAVRVLALCALDRMPEARHAHGAFLARWPASPLAAKLQDECPQLPAAH
jgi:hypothetical protein